ncbi:MAG TPA: zf-HC2 domain-containing protein [Armatimonadota bacterium]|jgi:hypothetical protein
MPTPKCESLEGALAAYVDGLAEPDEAVAVDAHLAECLACRLDVEAQRGSLLALASLVEAVPSPALRQSILASTTRRPSPVHALLSRLKIPSLAWSPLVVAAMALVVVAVLHRAPAGRETAPPTLPTSRGPLVARHLPATRNAMPAAPSADWSALEMVASLLRDRVMDASHSRAGASIAAGRPQGTSMGVAVLSPAPATRYRPRHSRPAPRPSAATYPEASEDLAGLTDEPAPYSAPVAPPVIPHDSEALAAATAGQIAASQPRAEVASVDQDASRVVTAHFEPARVPGVRYARAPSEAVEDQLRAMQESLQERGARPLNVRLLSFHFR